MGNRFFLFDDGSETSKQVQELLEELGASFEVKEASEFRLEYGLLPPARTFYEARELLARLGYCRRV